MALDLWIYGPGFGETIVMVWDDHEDAEGRIVRKAGIVDTYAGQSSDDQPALKCLEAFPGIEVAFVAVTHPHLDHMLNAYWMMERLDERIKNIFWWGGGYPDDLLLPYLEAKSKKLKLADEKESLTARMEESFLRAARKLAGHDGESARNARFMSMTAGTPSVFSLGAVTLQPIGPSAKEKQAYTHKFRNQFVTTKDKKTGEEVITVTPDTDLRANRTSLCMVLEYGEAQIVLGGDMEEANWDAWRGSAAGKKLKLRPSVVKVSHHGSTSGEIPKMWEGKGFFGSHKGTKNIKNMPICVITPWRRGTESKRLPNEGVKNRIKAAGCRLVVTASPPDQHGLALENRYCDSFVHIRVEKDGKAEIIEEKLCEVHPPLDAKG